MRVEVAKRVVALLGTRHIDVELTEVPGVRAKTWKEREQEMERLCGEAPDQKAVRRMIDISGASPEMALRLWQIATQQWGAGVFEVVSYDAGRNSLRVLGARGDAPEGRVVRTIDIGSDATGQKAVSVREFLGLFNLTVAYENPYGTDRKDATKASHLHAAAVGILSAARTEPEQYADCRRLLARAAGKRKTPVVISIGQVPNAMADTLLRLSDAELLVPEPSFNGGAYRLCPPWNKGAPFFLRGGWLEILVGDALRRALPDHKVEVNVGTAWGDGGPNAATYAEADAAFLYDNRLYVVSCKNEHDPDRLREHLDRFRALVAEYGEGWVRPVLVSTEGIDAPMLKRCRDYEIGCVCGDVLLANLAEDLECKAEPFSLRQAVLNAAVSPPAPGAKQT
jgi:hypothetical protein